MLNADSIEVSRNDEQSYLIASPVDMGVVDVHVATVPHQWPEAPLMTSQSHPIRLEGLDPAVRHYFLLRGSDGQSHAVAERALALHGGTNFRDFGGYRTHDGRQVRWGSLYRSGHMARLTEADVAYLATLDIRYCCVLAESKFVPD